ncbi:MAG: hypothetical protein ACYSSN_00015 [Planctomycetota bacterium]
MSRSLRRDEAAITERARKFGAAEANDSSVEAPKVAFKKSRLVWDIVFSPKSKPIEIQVM